MNVRPLLSASGEPVFGMGGDGAWKQLSRKGFHVSLEWAKDGKRWLRCLVIWPESRLSSVPGVARPGAWVIAHTAMVEFLHFNKDDHLTGRPSAHAVREAVLALPMLGKDTYDKQALYALLDIVSEFGPRVHEMPAFPPKGHGGIVTYDGDTEPMWDIETQDKSTGKTTSEASV